MPNETILIVYVFLFIFASCAMFLYYRRIREGAGESIRAKNILDDIILSFNRDIQRQEEKVEAIAIKGEKSSAENLKVIEEINSKIVGIKAQLEDLAKVSKESLSNYEDLRKKVEDIISQRAEVVKRITELESVGREIESRETRIESVIPIRKERALAPLTDTELKILKLLATEGEKTAPEIKEQVKLTREHTARLMKNLYMRGYVERLTDRIPYIYRLNKEMEDLLKRQRTEI